MSYINYSDPRYLERRALLAGSAAFALTSVHHTYGAIRYDTPWRLRAAVVAAVAVIAMLGALRLSRAEPESPTARAAWWAFWGINAAVFVLGVSLFEGLYNHLLENVLYLAGTPLARMRTLFPAPMYEMPNDWFLEVTGVLQVIPGAATAYYLGLLLRQRLRVAPRGMGLRPEIGSR